MPLSVDEFLDEPISADEFLDTQPEQEFQPAEFNLSPQSTGQRTSAIFRGIRESLSPFLGDTEEQAAQRLGGIPQPGLLAAPPLFRIPSAPQIPDAPDDSSLLYRYLTSEAQAASAGYNTVKGLAEGMMNPFAAMTLGAGSSRVPAAVFGGLAATHVPESISNIKKVLNSDEASTQQKGEAILGTAAELAVAAGGLTHAIRGERPSLSEKPVLEAPEAPIELESVRPEIAREERAPQSTELTAEEFLDAPEETPAAPKVDETGPVAASEPTPTGPVPSPEPAPSVPATVSAPETPSGPIGIKHADVDATLKGLGLAERDKPVPESEAIWWESALETAKNDPEAGSRLIDSLESNPRAMTDRETALGLHELATRRNEVTAADEALKGAADDLDREDANRRLTTALESYDKAARATAAGGTETGRGLRARRMMANEDYSLARMVTRARAASGGKELAPEVMSEVRKSHEAVQQNAKAQEAVASKQSEEAAKALFDSLLADIRKSAKASKQEGGPTFVDFMRSQRENARLRIRERLQSGQVNANPVGTLAAHIADEAIIGATYLAEGVTAFGKWSTEVVKDIGQKTEAYLKELYGRSREYHDANRDVFEEPSPTRSKAKAQAKNEEGVTRKMVYDLARAHVNEGVEGFDSVFEAVLKDVQEAFPNATLREVKDAFSDYGKVKLPSAESDKATLREYRRLAQLGSAIEDARAKIPPKRTGMQRDKPTQAIREKVKELREEMRKAGIQARDPQQQLASSLQSTKTRLTNSISDLQKEIEAIEAKINEGTPVPEKTRTNVQYDAEANKLKAERDSLAAHRDELKGMVAEMEGKPAMTDAERNAAAIRGAKVALEEVQRRIREKDFTKRKQPAFEQSEELKAARAELEKARSDYDSIRRASIDPDSEALARYKTAIRSRIKQLEDRMKRGDYTRKTRRDVELDAEGQKLRFESEKLKREFNEKLIATEMQNRPTYKKVFGAAQEASNLARALVTSYDLSAVLRQGGFITLGNPIRSAKAIPDMLRALVSERKQHAVMEEIRKRPNAPLYDRSKLYLSEEGSSLNKMEEAYMSRWTRKLADSKVPGVNLLFKGTVASERAYTTFLNRLRADSFDAMMTSLTKSGKATLEEARAIANFINVATGRGDVGGAAKAAVALNGVLFSPRYLLSRVQLLSGQPLYQGTARTRLLVAKEYAKFLTGAAVVYALAQAAGGSVETDSRSSDFLKLRFGNTRLDPMGGLIQLIVLGSRLGSGETKKINGQVVPIRGKVPYGGANAVNVMSQFARTKLAPLPGSLVNLVAGKDLLNQDVTLGSEAQRLLIPISIQDIASQLEQEDLPKTTINSLLALLGVGVQEYSSKKPEKPRTGM